MVCGGGTYGRSGERCAADGFLVTMGGLVNKFDLSKYRKMAQE